MLKYFRLVLFLLAGSTLGCSAPRPSAEAVALAHRLSTSCLGDITNNSARLLKAGTEVSQVQLIGSAGFDTGRLSGDGRFILGWNIKGLHLLDLESLSIQRLEQVAAPSAFDISTDGSVVAWVGAGQPSGAVGVFKLDVRRTVVDRVASSGDYVAVSPDGSAIAVEVGGRIQVYGHGLRTVDIPNGRWPAWLPDGKRLSFRESTNRYKILELSAGTSQTIAVDGNSTGAMQWSREASLRMYVTRTWSDSWLAPPSCPERYRVMLEETTSGNAVAFHVGCSLYPERLQWINRTDWCGTIQK